MPVEPKLSERLPLTNHMDREIGYGTVRDVEGGGNGPFLGSRGSANLTARSSPLPTGPSTQGPYLTHEQSPGGRLAGEYERRARDFGAGSSGLVFAFSCGEHTREGPQFLRRWTWQYGLANQ